jgi:hypothetical protein
MRRMSGQKHGYLIIKWFPFSLPNEHFCHLCLDFPISFSLSPSGFKGIMLSVYRKIHPLYLVTYTVICHHTVVSARVRCTLPSHCCLCWRMLAFSSHCCLCLRTQYVTITLLSILTYTVICHHIVFSADVRCTLPSHCCFCWRMLHVATTLLSLLTYAVRCHHTVISADVRCTLPPHCCLCLRTQYVTITLVSTLTNIVICHHTIVSADVYCMLPWRDSKLFEPSGP